MYMCICMPWAHVHVHVYPFENTCTVELLAPITQLSNGFMMI